MIFGTYLFSRGALCQVGRSLLVSVIDGVAMKNFFKKHFTKKRIIAFFVVRKIIALILIFCFLTPPPNVQAQAAPIANYAINRVIAGSVTKNVLKRGFAANDPRYAKTLEAISGNVTALNAASTGAGIVLTIAGAPVWLTIAASLGVFALGAYIFSDNSKLSVSNAGIKYDPAMSPIEPYVPSYPATNGGFVTSRLWFFKKYVAQGSKMYQGKPCYASQLCAALPPYPALYDPLIKAEYSPDLYGAEEVPYGTGNFIVTFDSLDELAAQLVLYIKPPNNQALGSISNSAGKVSNGVFMNWIQAPSLDVSADGKVRLSAIYSASFAGSPPYTGIFSSWFNPSEIWLSDQQPTQAYPIKANFIISRESAPSTYQDLDSFNDQLTPYQRSQPLTNETIARLADAAWRDAASKPNYEGIPYTNLDPVTESDVREYLVNGPRPTIGDLMRPALAPGADTVPIGDVGAGTGNGSAVGLIKDVNVMNSPDVKVINKIKIDLGDVPNTPQPNDWEIPSLDSIFEPFRLSILGNINPFEAVPHGGECPRPAIDLFGKTIVLDAHCSLMTEYAVTVALVLTLAYAYFAATIVLSA